MRHDYLKDCMSDPALVKGMVPIDEFNRVFCTRCFQKDCSRNASNGTLFNRRMENWKTDLFDKPPRASENDPNYANIRAKRFLQMADEVQKFQNGGVSYEVQTREMPPLPEALRQKETAEVIPPAADTEPEIQDPPSVPVPAGLPPAASPPAAQPTSRTAPLQNTQFDQGVMLPGAPSPSGPEEKTVEVGGTYVFGSE